VNDLRADLSEPGDPLVRLRDDFPQFEIWRENICGRRRYIARSRHLNVNPYTVVTEDPAELRAALSGPAE
jgi:hypothetical protein